MLVGVAVGVIASVAAKLSITASVRPDAAIALVLVVPTFFGLLLLLLSGSRWVTALGTFCLAVAPGWFGVLVLAQVVHGA